MSAWRRARVSSLRTALPVAAGDPARIGERRGLREPGAVARMSEVAGRRLQQPVEPLFRFGAKWGGQGNALAAQARGGERNQQARGRLEAGSQIREPGV